jgi:DHA1 family bicyclomycin/chloramphenicol resistance-like MFS transporter
MTASTTDSPRAGWVTTSLVAQMALGLLAMTICVPSMLDWPAAFGASQAEVQLTFSAYVATHGLLQLVHGPLSDRLGRKPVLLIGLALCLAGAVMASLAPNLATLIGARMLQGTGSAAGMVVGRAMVQDLFVGAQRTRMMAFVGMTMGVVPAVSMLLGGFLHVHLGWRSNFVLLAVATVVTAVISWRFLPEPSRADDPGPANVMRGYLALLRRPDFLLHVFILAGTTATFYTYLAGAPVVFKSYGVSAETLGLYIMVIPLSYIAGNAMTTQLIARHGGQRLMAWGQIASFFALGLVLVLGLIGVPSPLALALPLIFLGIGHGLMVPPALTGTVGLVPALAGSASALAGVLQQASGSLGGYFVALVPHHGSVNLALLMIAWMGLSLLAQWLLFRRPASAA